MCGISPVKIWHKLFVLDLLRKWLDFILVVVRNLLEIVTIHRSCLLETKTRSLHRSGGRRCAQNYHRPVIFFAHEWWHFTVDLDRVTPDLVASELDRRGDNEVHLTR